MKTFALSLAVLMGSVIFAQDLSTPESTFKTLLTAIENQDLELYKRCWVEESLEGEGMYTNLKTDPDLWEELKAIFHGPQTLKETEPMAGATKFKTTVIAPEAEGGGIGTITMILEGEEWRMYRW